MQLCISIQHTGVDLALSHFVPALIHEKSTSQIWAAFLSWVQGPRIITCYRTAESRKEIIHLQSQKKTKKPCDVQLCFLRLLLQQQQKWLKQMYYSNNYLSTNAVRSILFKGEKTFSKPKKVGSSDQVILQSCQLGVLDFCFVRSVFSSILVSW